MSETERKKHLEKIGRQDEPMESTKGTDQNCLTNPFVCPSYHYCTKKDVCKKEIVCTVQNGFWCLEQVSPCPPNYANK
jgi:hypothetical protein